MEEPYIIVCIVYYIYRKTPKQQLCLILSSIIGEFIIYFYLPAFCCCSVAQSCPALCSPMDCSALGFTISRSFLKLMSIELVMPSNHLASVIPFSSCSQFFSALGSILMSWLFTSGDQSIGASVSVLPVNIQDLFPLGLTGLISLQSNRLSSHLQYHSSKAIILEHSAFFMVQLSHPYMTTGKAICIEKNS